VKIFKESALAAIAVGINAGIMSNPPMKNSAVVLNLSAFRKAKTFIAATRFLAS
jgi:hypothetical protein